MNLSMTFHHVFPNSIDIVIYISDSSELLSVLWVNIVLWWLTWKVSQLCMVKIYNAAHVVKTKMTACCSFNCVNNNYSYLLFSSVPSLQLKWLVSASVLVYSNYRLYKAVYKHVLHKSQLGSLFILTISNVMAKASITPIPHEKALVPFIIDTDWQRG